MRFAFRPTHQSTTALPGDSDPAFDDGASPSVVRRQKLSRLRKMLGEEVPLDLVFPGQKENIRDGQARNVISADERLDPLTPVPVAGTVIPRPKKVGVGKIVGARDSMGSLTPHRAKRQDRPSAEDAPPPPLPFSPLVAIPSTPSPRGQPQKQLCSIVECPDEHGSSLFEGFGFGGSGTKKTKPTIVMESSWHVTSGARNSGAGLEDTNNLWSTRKGYGGWDRPVVMQKSEAERKKSMSYRKPPPPIDF